MANGGDLRLTAAGASTEQESPVVPPPPPPPRSTAPNRVNLTEENQSLLNSVRSYTTLTPQEKDTCKQSLFNLVTSNEEDAQFREVVSRLDGDGIHLRKMALLLTSDVDGIFLPMARNKTGSNRMQELLGNTEDVDIFFFNAILRRFFHVMSDRNASRVAIQGMRVFSEDKKTALSQNVINHAVNMACHRHGFAVLKRIINEWYALGNLFYRDQLLCIVAHNALHLSHNSYGNYVVQHVLDLYDLRYTHDVAVSLSGHCFGLSFTKTGGYVVEKLLDSDEAVMVVGELLYGCDGESLARLTRSEFGSFVVKKALRVMRARNRKDLLCRLVYKLRPFVYLLRGSHGDRIGEYVDSYNYY